MDKEAIDIMMVVHIQANHVSIDLDSRERSQQWD
jgi:hypothetical protein